MPQPGKGGHAAPVVRPPVAKGSGGKPSAAGEKNSPKGVHSSGVKGSGSK